MDTVRNSNRGTSCYLADWEKMITSDSWVSTAFQYRPQQQLLQRLPRLPFAALGVAVAGVAAADAGVVVAAAAHGPVPGRARAAYARENHVRGDPAW